MLLGVEMGGLGAYMMAFFVWVLCAFWVGAGWFPLGWVWGVDT